jgi:hypothetical protein
MLNHSHTKRLLSRLGNRPIREETKNRLQKKLSGSALAKRLRAQVEETTSDYDREKLQERLAKLAGGLLEVVRFDRCRPGRERLSEEALDRFVESFPVKVLIRRRSSDDCAGWKIGSALPSKRNPTGSYLRESRQDGGVLQRHGSAAS